MIRQLLSKDDLLQGYKVLKELRTHLVEDTFLTTYEKMKEEGYEIYGCFDEGEVVAVAGVIRLTNFYDGYHLYVYDLVTRSSGRSKGYGTQLLSHLECLAQEKGCENITLSSGLQRAEAHRFYLEKMNYEKTSYVFKKKL